MTPEVVDPQLKLLAAYARKEVPNATLFVFGSYITRATCPSDIDVLALCETNAEADAIRRAFYAFGSALPFHLTILTRSEEAESGFIHRAGAIELSI